MANEISVQTGLTCRNGSDVLPSTATTTVVTQSAAGSARALFAITTTDTAFTLPLTSPGMAEIKNTGSTTVEWGFDTGSSTIAAGMQLSAGRTAVVELKSATTTIRAKTASGTSTLQVTVLKA